MMTMIVVFDFNNNKVSYKTYEGDCTENIERAINLNNELMETNQNISFDKFKEIIKREII